MSTKEISLKFIILGLLAICATVLISDQIIYKYLIVPQLNRLHHVPYTWWIGVFSPILLCGIIIGLKTKNKRELIIISILAAFLSVFYNHVAAATHQPGHLKSIAIESPIEFWTIGSLISIILYIVLLGSGFVIAKFFKRKGDRLNTL